ncbi:hypothetical protein F8S13_03415 [Chloroflexia bacterium SDU3-3]|nr:hypothetical protein F8S13_03415 [Chloroflexia bacterium SDU3-3]
MLVFLATIPLPRIDNHLIGSDGTSYYATIRSLVIDHDFDFTNDYQLLGVRSPAPTAQGVPPNPFAIGAPLLWGPFFLAAHGVSLLLSALGVTVPTDGLGYIYEAAICLGSIVYASLGFTMLYSIARRFGSVLSALVATLAMWWATQALYYIIAEPSMSHATTLFTVSLFLLLWYPPDAQRSPLRWLGIGLSVALVALTRWQDGVVILIPLAEIAWWLYKRNMSLGSAALSFALCISAVAVGFLPQMIMWHAIYGTILTLPQGNDFFMWSNPQVLPTLFSTRHGLLSWHPIFILALIGIISLWKIDRSAAAAALFFFLCQLYINSAAARWWADDAFGGRRFTSAIPLLTLALAALIGACDRSQRRRLILAALALLVVWNGLCFAQYRLGFVSMSQALTLREMTIDRLLMPWYLLQKVAR